MGSRSSGAARGDTTAAGPIRDAAMRLFAERGFDGTGVRDVAAAAGVSAPLVIHYYGSKAGLKAVVDRRAIELLTELIEHADLTAADAGSASSLSAMFAALAQRQPALTPYLRRLLVDGGPPANLLFRSLYEVARAAIAGLRERGLARPAADEDLRAAFLLVSDLGAVLLREQVRAIVGVDPLARPGFERWGDTRMRVYTDGVLLPGGEEDSR